jgi:guanylate kinase
LFVVGPGLLFVVSGPSGAGKDTLVERLLSRMGPRMRYSVSATTRAPRPGEVEGRDYFFLTREDFLERVGRGAFLEWRDYNGNLYGTPRGHVEDTLAGGHDLIMKPEVNGALAARGAYPQAVLIFVLPDKFEHLESRLAARQTETTDEIAKRLAIAREETKFIKSFDYLIINEQSRVEGGKDLPAVDALEAIVKAERLRIHHYDETTLRNFENA